MPLRNHTLQNQPQSNVALAMLTTEQDLQSIADAVERVEETLSPVWPLADYVAVNPYAGVSGSRFVTARRFMRLFSDIETLMPLDYYAGLYQDGGFHLADVETSLEELRADGQVPLNDLQAADVVARLAEWQVTNRDPSVNRSRENPDRRLRTVAEWLDRGSQTDWSGTVAQEISKLCAAHYDDGQALWQNPWKDLSLFNAWRAAAIHDRTMERLDISGFRWFVSQVPESPEAAIAFCLHWMGVPQRLWEAFLLCHGFATPGWSAWIKYQATMAARNGRETNDVAGLLAIRLIYDAALGEHFSFHVDWDAIHTEVLLSDDSVLPDDEWRLRYVLLRASEIAYRNQLIGKLRPVLQAASPASEEASPGGEQPPATVRPQVQMVFCIDVRSERFRRNLEAVTDTVETFGFAGFFALPVEYVSLGQTSGSHQVPVLLSPQFQLHEGLRCDDLEQSDETLERRTTRRLGRKAWKAMQNSAISCFAFVESAGWLYGINLLSRGLGIARTSSDVRYDGVEASVRDDFGPTLRGLEAQGITSSRQADLAESILRNLSLTSGFARLVVFCGHGSQTENNPLQAGLDCGACGGHSGEVNARFAALLLNHPQVRETLADRGIPIPADTHFLAALHNTTTDDIDFFDRSLVPATHHADLDALIESTRMAAEQTRLERLPVVDSKNTAELFRRCREWSEVRPEWGLAGNAAFVAGPRCMTNSLDLQGRVFLHSYEHQQDPEGQVLEQIMTAPLVVAHWINMQYYASTVDNLHYGSGTKTVHNVVGRFGLYSGNGGDLMTGLPWQSLHTGDHYQHQPMRLLAVLAAPRAAIEKVIAKHDMLDNLLSHDWLNLLAVDEGQLYRYTTDHQWQACLAGEALPAEQVANPNQFATAFSAKEH